MSRLLVSSPSVLRGVGEAADFLVEPTAPGTEDRPQALRHRLARRLVEGPVMSYSDLGADELNYVRERRTRLVRDLEQLTGCHVESRAEGMSLVDATIEPITEPRHRFPSGGTLTQAALLWGAALVELAATGDEVIRETVLEPDDEVRLAPAAERWVNGAAADEAWEEFADRYRSKFSSDYRESPDKLRREVGELLARFGLLAVEGDRLRVHAALARYRPDADAEVDGQTSENALTSQMFGDDQP